MALLKVEKGCFVVGFEAGLLRMMKSSEDLAGEGLLFKTWRNPKSWGVFILGGSLETPGKWLE